MSNGPSRSSSSVCDAVQCDASGEHEVPLARAPEELPGHPEHDLLGHRLNTGRKIHVALGQVGLRGPWRPAEQLVELRPGHREALAVVEVVEVEPEAPIGLHVDQVLVDGFLVHRAPVRSEPHEFVFTAVDLEPAVVGERRVQKAERMRKREVVRQPDVVAASHPKVVVLHSPTPSSVRIAARANGLGKNALAA